MQHILKTVLFGSLISCMSVYANSTISDAIKAGTVDLNFRYRYEHVDQNGVSKNAGASTLRSRFSYKSAIYSNFILGFEADGVTVIGSERYDSTENGKTRYPVVADPEGFDLNQFYVKYKASIDATLGRQRILHDSQRFVGGVAWRQNEQTYDAIRFEKEFTQGLRLDYTHTWNVNRIFGPDDGAQPANWHGASHLFKSEYQAGKHKTRFFAYLLDFENDNGLPNSSATYGLAYATKFGPVAIDLSLATQSNYADNPISYDAFYYFVAAKWKLKAVTLNVGFEVLGSDDGAMSFRTPLATLHKFQGWADKFLVTPENGIEDLYLGVAGTIHKAKLAATWHQFESEESGIDYGSEIDMVVTYPLNKQFSIQFKLADYHSDSFATDTLKAWFTFNLKF